MDQSRLSAFSIAPPHTRRDKPAWKRWKNKSKHPPNFSPKLLRPSCSPTSSSLFPTFILFLANSSQMSAPVSAAKATKAPASKKPASTKKAPAAKAAPKPKVAKALPSHPTYQEMVIVSLASVYLFRATEESYLPPATRFNPPCTMLIRFDALPFLVSPPFLSSPFLSRDSMRHRKPSRLLETRLESRDLLSRSTCSSTSHCRVHLQVVPQVWKLDETPHDPEYKHTRQVVCRTFFALSTALLASRPTGCTHNTTIELY